VPILASSTRSTSPIGKRTGFADIGATVASHLDLQAPVHGAHF
jgi:phosphopentomutase